jgi:hypothetical protein
MRKPIIVWVSLAVLYGAFLLWYDGGGGPLRPEEIERHVATLEQRGLDAGQIASLRAFLTSDPGGDFVMANYIHFRDVPLAGGDLRPGETSQQALDRYMAHMYPALFRRACHPVLAGPVVAKALDLWGIDDAASWSLVGLVRYRSRRDMIEIATDPAFSAAYRYKTAALQQTIAVPVEPFLMLGNPRVVLALAATALGSLLQLALGRRAA